MTEFLGGRTRVGTTGVQATIYSFGDDPLLPGVSGPIQLIGRSNRDEDSTIVGCTWQKVLGAPAGEFTLQVKANDRTKFLQNVVDDDWVDISFTRGDEVFHVCRGLIDTIRETTTVSGGATQRIYQIRGRDHGKVWQQTQVYFNRFIAENIGGSALLRVFAATNDNIFGDVPTTVFAFLRQFLLDQENNSAGVFWSFPTGIPGVTQNAKFTDVVRFLSDNGGVVNGVGYTDQPPRVSFQAAFLDPQGNNLWNLAQQWSDPMFCELYTEVVNAETNAIPGPGEQLRPEDSAIAVIVRDRPFPYGDNLRNDSGWFKLPLVQIPLQELGSNVEIGRGGEERYNAFFIKGKAFSEYASNNVDLVAPLLDIEDIRRHGFRRFDSTTDYVPAPDSSWRDFIDFQRSQVRDWHCLNPYLLNGVIPLRSGFPDIRVGTRVRVLGEQGSEGDQTYYVEGLTHTWQLVQGTKTTLQVSRGWIGTDDTLLQAIRDSRFRYSVIAGEPGSLDLLDVDGSFIA